MRGDKGSPPGAKGSFYPHGPAAKPPAVAAERDMKGAPAVTEPTEALDFELNEQKHKKWFRSVMMLVLPIVAFGWLALIAWATLTDRIKGVQVGIVLGIAGAGLLTLLGLQIAWAYSQKNKAAAHPAAATLEAIRKLLGNQ